MTPARDDPPAEATGVGGLLEDPHHVRGDLQLLGKYLGCGSLSAARIERPGASQSSEPPEPMQNVCPRRLAAYRTG